MDVNNNNAQYQTQSLSPIDNKKLSKKGVDKTLVVSQGIIFSRNPFKIFSKEHKLYFLDLKNNVKKIECKDEVKALSLENSDSFLVNGIVKFLYINETYRRKEEPQQEKEKSQEQPLLNKASSQTQVEEQTNESFSILENKPLDNFTIQNEGEGGNYIAIYKGEDFFVSIGYQQNTISTGMFGGMPGQILFVKILHEGSREFISTCDSTIVGVDCEQIQVNGASIHKIDTQQTIITLFLSLPSESKSKTVIKQYLFQSSPEPQNKEEEIKGKGDHEEA